MPEILNTEREEAMREEFERIWNFSIYPLVKPEPKDFTKVFVACWTAYCIGARVVLAPKEPEPKTA